MKQQYDAKLNDFGIMKAVMGLFIMHDFLLGMAFMALNIWLAMSFILLAVVMIAYMVVLDRKKSLIIKEMNTVVVE